MGQIIKEDPLQHIARAAPRGSGARTSSPKSPHFFQCTGIEEDSSASAQKSSLQNWLCIFLPLFFSFLLTTTVLPQACIYPTIKKAGFFVALMGKTKMPCCELLCKTELSLVILSLCYCFCPLICFPFVATVHPSSHSQRRSFAGLVGQGSTNQTWPCLQ